MRARTTSALSVLAGAIVAAAVLGAPTTAQAAPEAAYPAPAPAIRVSAASITTGGAVRLSGRSFLAGEPISIDIQYRITRNSGGYDNPWGVRVSGDRRADGEGRFSARIRLGTPGYAIIKVTGKKSHKTLKVAVRVQAWRNVWPDDIFDGTPLGSGPSHGDRHGGGGDRHGGGGDRPVGYFGPFRSGWSPFRLSADETDTATTAVALSDSAAGAVVAGAVVRHEPGSYGADLVPGLLGLAALVGSAVVGRRFRRIS
jgi:hypothetical protein